MARSSKTATIVVLGGINMDLIGTAPRLPMPGETLLGESFYTSPGGKGANQAVAAAKLGAYVRMVGRVGEDFFGPMLLDGLRENGVDVRGVSTDSKHASGIGMILLDAKKQNYIVAIYGANRHCDADQVTAVETALDGADVLLLQNEVPIEVSVAAAKAAHERNIRVIWDPGPSVEMPSSVYRLLDIITPNQTEATFLTEMEVNDVKSAQAAANALADRVGGVGVVTLGEMGVCYAHLDRHEHMAPFEVDAVDTVAAGDAFAGALAVALGEGRDLEVAIQYGNAAGALAVTRPGSQDAMPSTQEIEALLLAKTNGTFG